MVSAKAWTAVFMGDGTCCSFQLSEILPLQSQYATWSKEFLGRSAALLKGVFFNKRQGSNWKVPWHQDLTITVAGRIDQSGFGSWTIKGGVQNVQPPVFSQFGYTSMKTTSRVGRYA